MSLCPRVASWQEPFRLSLFPVCLSSRAGPANLEFLFVERQEPMVMLWSVRCFPRRFDFVSHFGESTVVQRRRDTCTREPRRKTEKVGSRARALAFAR